MTTEVVTVGADATVAEAARLMDRNAVKRLPVVSEDGVLVGIVSRSDLLRPFTRPDGEPRREVVEQIAEGILIVEPSRVDVLVSDGIVRLDGRVARHSQAKLAEQLAGGVDGVAAVDNYLRSDLDDTMPARRAASLAVSGRRPPLPPGPRPRPTGLARR